MMHTIVKTFVDYEKEEIWLNEMAAKGLAMVNYTFCKYTFEDCEPGEYQYRIELLDNLPSHAESRKYISFMNENGAEHICTYVRWVYFRAKAGEYTFNIYSDMESKINHFRRIRTLWFALILLAIPSGTSNLFIGIRHINDGIFPSFNLAIGVGLLCMGLFVLSRYIKYGWKIKRLKKEREITE